MAFAFEELSTWFKFYLLLVFGPEEFIIHEKGKDFHYEDRSLFYITNGKVSLEMESGTKI